MKRVQMKEMVESQYPPKDKNVLWVDKDESTGEITSIKKFKDGEWITELSNSTDSSVYVTLDESDNIQSEDLDNIIKNKKYGVEKITLSDSAKQHITEGIKQLAGCDSVELMSFVCTAPYNAGTNVYIEQQLCVRGICSKNQSTFIAYGVYTLYMERMAIGLVFSDWSSIVAKQSSDIDSTTMAGEINQVSQMAVNSKCMALGLSGEPQITSSGICDLLQAAYDKGKEDASAS